MKIKENCFVAPFQKLEKSKLCCSVGCCHFDQKLPLDQQRVCLCDPISVLFCPILGGFKMKFLFCPILGGFQMKCRPISPIQFTLVFFIRPRQSLQLPQPPTKKQSKDSQNFTFYRLLANSTIHL